jgi:hypothetical protein
VLYRLILCSDVVTVEVYRIGLYIVLTAVVLLVFISVNILLTTCTGNAGYANALYYQQGL